MTARRDATDYGEVIDVLANLVRINSVNPNYADGVPELACAEFVEDYLLNSGLEVWRQEVMLNRPNILAKLPGTDRSRQVVFEAHTDTVSTQGMAIDAFDPRVEKGKLYGRGACDTKGGLAAMMYAIASLARQGIQPTNDILLVAAIDEEYSYRGVLEVCAGDEPRQLGQVASGQPLQAQLAVVAEPTSLKLVVASKGVLRWKIETIGQAAHSSKPHLGRNAIVAMARVIHALQADSRRLDDQHHPLLGSPTLNIGLIHGGVQVNFVPERCVIELDRRLIPGETWQEAYHHYQQVVDRLMEQDSTVEIVMHQPMLTDLPLNCPSDSSVVRQLSSILTSMNLDGQPQGVPFGSDASKFAAIGIPSIIFGPGSIDQAHAAIEFVECQQVVTAADFYRRIMLNGW